MQITDTERVRRGRRVTISFQLSDAMPERGVFFLRLIVIAS